MCSDNKFERCKKFWSKNYFVKSKADLLSNKFSIFLLQYLNLELFLNLIFWFSEDFFINLEEVTYSDN